MFNSIFFCTFAGDFEKSEKMFDEKCISFYTEAHKFFVSEDGKLHFAQTEPKRIVSVRELFNFIKHDEHTASVTETFRTMTDGEVPNFGKLKVTVDDFEALNLPEDTPVWRNKKPDTDGVFWVHYAVQDGIISAKEQFKITRFPFVQPFGTFKQRTSKALLKPSGMWCVDFDHFAGSIEDVERVKDALLQDENARPCLLFTSPSGDGLKAFYLFEYVEDENERTARVRGLYKYLRKQFPDLKQIDGKHAGKHAIDDYKDVTHCCNVPHDENARFNPDAFTRLDWNVWRVDEPAPVIVSFVDTGENTHDKVVWYVNELVSSGIDVTAGMSAGEHTALAAAFASFPDGEELFQRVSSLWPKYSRRQCHATFASVQRHPKADFRLFVKLAVEALNGRTWEKDSLQGQRATDEFKRAKREEFNASPAGAEWRAQKERERQMQKMNTTENDTEAVTASPTTAQPKSKKAASNANALTADEIREIFLKSRDTKSLIHFAAQMAVSIPTGYVFGSDTKREPFTLKSQALTVIGAGTSHGKTRFLENVLLRAAKYNDEDVNGTCLFFTLEESLSDVLPELVNLHAGVREIRHEEFTNNFTAYADAFRRIDTGETRYFQNDIEFAHAKINIEKFFTEFTETDAVRVIDDEMFRDVDNLCAACRLFASEQKLKAIFIDHLGMMTKRGQNERVPRTERIEQIVTQLELLAKELNVPFVLTQQMARTAVSAEQLQNENLADSADVERSANTVVLLWNSSVLPKDNTSKEYARANGAMKASERLSENGFFYGVHGAIYAKLAKRRGGIRDVWTVFDFDGATGQIKPMTPERAAEMQRIYDYLKNEVPCTTGTAGKNGNAGAAVSDPEVKKITPSDIFNLSKKHDKETEAFESKISNDELPF